MQPLRTGAEYIWFQLEEQRNLGWHWLVNLTEERSFDQSDPFYAWRHPLGVNDTQTAAIVARRD
jgi:hypothetical protein